MRDFTVSNKKDNENNNKEREQYIKSVRKVKRLNGTECYEITYADGRKFSNIMCNEENLTKIEKRQEQQAAKAFANKTVFENRTRKYKFSSITGAILTTIATSTPLSMVINGTAINANTQALPIALGTIFAGATLYSFINFLSNKGKVAQLEKIEYVNNNKKELENLNSYENSLVGLPKYKRFYFKNSKKPFSILEIENYSKKDLQTIMSNIDREKTYNFEYNKKKVKTREEQPKTK